MRDTAFKLLPFVFGGILGWLIFKVPSFLGSLGWSAYVLGGVLVVALFLGFTAFSVLTNLPAQLRISPAPESAITVDLRRLSHDLRSLGFHPGPPVYVHMAPTSVLLPFLHESDPIYAIAFRTGTTPAVTTCDLVSILEGDRGGLTTGSHRWGGNLPESDRALKQIFHGAGVADLLREHRKAMAHVNSRGLGWRPLRIEEAADCLHRGIRMHREAFLAAPLRGVLVAVWRILSQRNPYLTPLEKQASAHRQIERLLAGV